MKIDVVKTFDNLPCAHAQFFDKNEDGSPGPCAALHGYSRSVTITVSGDLDENRWVIGFGDFKPIKKFLEYYFDHTSLLPANDPRLEDALKAHKSGILGTLRVLPFGVSMEMSGLFALYLINAYIVDITKGRCYISKLEMRENSKNAAVLELSRNEALYQALYTINVYRKDLKYDSVLIETPFWGKLDFVNDSNGPMSNDDDESYKYHFAKYKNKNFFKDYNLGV